ncbi:MAG: hypothetical protein ACRDON_03115 [Gaiellaceae bacterium]
MGIGFLSLIIGAVSERFIATEVREEVEEAEAEVEEDLAAVQGELLGEIRAIGERLREVEARIGRLRTG